MLLAVRGGGRGYAALCDREPTIPVGGGSLADIALENGFARLASAGLRHPGDADLLADADSVSGGASRGRNPAELVSMRGGVAADSRDAERDPHLRWVCVRGRFPAGEKGPIRPAVLEAFFR